MEDINSSLQADQVSRLLAVESSKQWQLISRIENGKNVFGSCVEDNTLVFVRASPIDSLYIIDRPVNCGANSAIDTLYKAKYKIITDNKEDLQYQITMSEEKFQTIKTISIHDLTSQRLEVRYSSDEVMIEEQYTAK